MERYICTLTDKARLGDTNASNELITINYNLIRNKALVAYNMINAELKNINNKYILSSNIKELDDIIQELCIKSIYILDTFLKRHDDKYFSSYLNDALTSYIDTYVKKTVKSIIVKDDYEIIQNIDTTFMKYIDKLHYNEEIKEILFMIENDIYLKKYETFIKNILSGLSYEELSRISNLDKRNINIKINNFKELYNRKKIELNLLYVLGDKQIFNIIKNGDIYTIDYYKNIIDKYILSIYNEISNTLIDYEEIKNEILVMINKLIIKYINNNSFNLSEFNNYLVEKLREKKYRYIKRKKVKVKKLDRD